MTGPADGSLRGRYRNSGLTGALLADRRAEARNDWAGAMRQPFTSVGAAGAL